MEFPEHLISLGAISGTITSLMFLILHQVVLDTPIWFVTPMAIIFGLLTGLTLAWSYTIYFSEFNLKNTFVLHGLYLLPIPILILITLLLFEPKWTFEEANDPANTDELLSTAFSIVIPFALIYGILQGILYKKNNKSLQASISTNLVILTGIGHNFPLFVLVEFDADGSVLLSEIKILVYSF
jgi:hypothetical protein